VGEQTGWAIEASSLREVLTDRQRVADGKRPLSVGFWFSLGHSTVVTGLTVGLAFGVKSLGRQLLDDPAYSADPWRLLLRLADLHCLLADFGAAEQCHRQAWRHALGRERQAASLHSIGVRQFEQGDRDAAAASFQLSLTLLSLFGDTPARARTTAGLALVRAGAGVDPAFDAVILAGGRGSRMGGPAKPLRKLAGWPMLDHVLLASSAASRQIVVGPSRIGIGAPVFCREQPAGSGPVAATSSGRWCCCWPRTCPSSPARWRRCARCWRVAQPMPQRWWSRPARSTTSPRPGGPRRCTPPWTGWANRPGARCERCTTRSSSRTCRTSTAWARTATRRWTCDWPRAGSSGTARDGCQQRSSHGLDWSCTPRHELDLPGGLVQQHRRAADHWGAGGGQRGGQRRRPRVIDRLQQRLLAAKRQVCVAVRGAGRQRGDDQVGLQPVPPLGQRSQRDRQSQPARGRQQRRGPGRLADQHGDGAG